MAIYVKYGLSLAISGYLGLSLAILGCLFQVSSIRGPEDAGERKLLQFKLFCFFFVFFIIDRSYRGACAPKKYNLQSIKQGHYDTSRGEEKDQKLFCQSLILHIKGVEKKKWTFKNHSNETVSPASNMLESCYIFHSKGGIHSCIWITKTFLYNIKELRYEQPNVGY